MSQLGQKFNSTGSLLNDYSSFITSDTDLKCFIKVTKSETSLPKNVIAQVYVPSMDI